MSRRPVVVRRVRRHPHTSAEGRTVGDRDEHRVGRRALAVDGDDVRDGPEDRQLAGDRDVVAHRPARPAHPGGPLVDDRVEPAAQDPDPPARQARRRDAPTEVDGTRPAAGDQGRGGQRRRGRAGRAPGRCRCRSRPRRRRGAWDGRRRGSRRGGPSRRRRPRRGRRSGMRRGPPAPGPPRWPRRVRRGRRPHVRPPGAPRRSGRRTRPPVRGRPWGWSAGRPAGTRGRQARAKATGAPDRHIGVTHQHLHLDAVWCRQGAHTPRTSASRRRMWSDSRLLRAGLRSARPGRPGGCARRRTRRAWPDAGRAAPRCRPRRRTAPPSAPRGRSSTTGPARASSSPRTGR